MSVRIPVVAVVGDYSAAVAAHRGVDATFAAVRLQGQRPPRCRWLRTSALGDVTQTLAGVQGLWVVPGSPYENTPAVLAAIRWAREQRLPFLGTCGGFQHALLEMAHSIAGIPTAAHEEAAPEAPIPLISRLACSLVEQTGVVHLGGSLRDWIGTPTTVEGYHCNYGLNSRFIPLLTPAGIRFDAWDEAGEVRGFTLADHPFFCGTLFQPERRGLLGRVHPLLQTFFSKVWAT